MALSELPSVDQLLSSDPGARLVALYGRQQVTRTIRGVLGDIRESVTTSGREVPPTGVILAAVSDRLDRANESRLRTVINLTGTVLHTNLGRSPLPPEAIERMASVAAEPSNLEFDIDAGQRGDRESHIEDLIVETTGGEAATVVNNNAAAVLLVLNTLALDRHVPVSRGELVEIGGSFRIPEIMSRAGCHLVEVGATNRTHLADYQNVMGPDTALLMKVHTSNYEISGFTSAVPDAELSALAREHGIPLVTDLGSGTLVDLRRYGLPYEPTVQAALDHGASLVTFSGDKLLGGPQAGIIVGRRKLVAQLKANPMKRALRADKLTIAALAEVLKLYRDPDTLSERLPALRLLVRTPESILQTARELLPYICQQLDSVAEAEIQPTLSQVGSGSLPLDRLPGYAIAIRPRDSSDEKLRALARAFRRLPQPVIGRIHDGRLLLDLRTLEHTRTFIEQISRLNVR
jgi:L-seryl-tRNA(Ser) seleniumtransferase